ncbi:MAG: hypothetical protein SVY53_11105 [Chloroflexota bacterium]|nr:hypothetical protein [Chloroflexota bacterium]
MKAILVIAAIMILLIASFGLAIADWVDPNNPAPSSGDGIPDGSGRDDWPNGGPGPAPNSGDGIPDGNGF